jgi:hypothetical protein
MEFSNDYDPFQAALSHPVQIKNSFTSSPLTSKTQKDQAIQPVQNITMAHSSTNQHITEGVQACLCILLVYLSAENVHQDGCPITLSPISPFSKKGFSSTHLTGM